jgi:hypothetical protein
VMASWGILARGAPGWDQWWRAEILVMAYLIGQICRGSP